MVFAVYFPVLRNGFTGFDDGEYVVDNVHVSTGLTRENVVWAFTARHSNNWHPLTWISHAIDASLYGLSPRGHHLTSLLLHVANTILIFLWLSNVTGYLGRSAFVALGFGLHPLHVESVAWVAERKDVLSTFFWVLTLIAYTVWTRKRGVAMYLLTAGLLTAGLLSKQMLVTVPALLLVMDRWPLKRTETWRRLLIEKIPLFALSALAAGIVIFAQRAGGAAASLDQLPLTLRLSNAFLSYFRYIGKTVWPSGLSVFYPFPAEGIAPWTVVACLAAMTGVSALVWMLRRQRPWLAAGWMWYVLTLLPVIGIVQVGMQAMADRYMYMPMTGLLIAVSWEAAELMRISKTGFRLIPVAAVLVLTAWAAVSWRHIPVWQDGVTLFTHALRVDPGNFLAHDNLGVELDRRGRYDDALEHYRETLRLNPGDRHGKNNYAMASFAKGERLLSAGKSNEALAAFRDGLRYKPRYALAHTQIGRILSGQKQIPEAITEFRTAVDIDPSLAAAHMGLAVALAWSGHAAEAQKSFETVLRFDPNNVEAHFDLGIVLGVLEKPQEAIKHLQAAIRLNPRFGPAHAALAEVYTSAGKYAEAWRAISAARAANTEVDPALVSHVAAKIRAR